MFDFIKAVIPAMHREMLLNNPLLDFKLEVSEKTGEVGRKSIAEYKGLKFIVFTDSTYMELQGSVHKYYNGGIHNANQFGLNELLWVILDFSMNFNIQLETLILKNIEIGLNFDPLIKTNKVLNQLLIHLGEKFKECNVGKGNYKQVRHQRYYLKAYNKLLQYSSSIIELPTDENMRFEIKFVRMVDLNKMEIYCLQDIFEPTRLNQLKEILLKKWNECILFDKTIRKEELKPFVANKKYYQWSNCNYWLELTKQRRNEQLRQYKNVVANHSDHVQSEIANIMNNTWSTLINNSLPINQRIINTHFVTN